MRCQGSIQCLQVLHDGLEVYWRELEGGWLRSTYRGYQRLRSQKGWYEVHNKTLQYTTSYTNFRGRRCTVAAYRLAKMTGFG
jgi:hypothetical protein